ncbi:hypothetical protein ACDX78_12540 [Virgibacillus oceani]
MENPLLKEYIQTGDKSIERVVESIAESASIELLPDRRRKLGKLVDRFSVTFKEIRRIKKALF